MFKFLLALGLCLSLGQLEVGAVDLEDMEQYLARYQYLGGMNVGDMMGRVKAAVDEDYESHNFHVLKFYRDFRAEKEVKSSEHIMSVTSAFSRLNNCVISHQLSQECIEIVEQDRCNIKLKNPPNKQLFYYEVEQAQWVPGFSDVNGLVSDVRTLREMVEQMDFESEINSVESFEAYAKSAHELMIFHIIVDFAEMMVWDETPERLYRQE